MTSCNEAKAIATQAIANAEAAAANARKLEAELGLVITQRDEYRLQRDHAIGRANVITGRLVELELQAVEQRNRLDRAIEASAKLESEMRSTRVVWFGIGALTTAVLATGVIMVAK